MDNFGVRITSRSGAAVLADGELTVRPLRWSGVAQGGYEAAVVELRGPRPALLAARQWLRYGVSIYSAQGTPLWAGYVHSVEVHGLGMGVGSTLEGVANRVAVKYRAQDAGAASETTAWLEDAASIAEYGYKEQLISLGTGTPDMAAWRRANKLQAFARPQPLRAFDDSGAGDDYALLQCRGLAATLAWRYVQRTDGRVEWLGNGKRQEQPIGWMIVDSTLVGFGKSGLIDDAGRLGALREGHKVYIMGGVHNGWALTVSHATNEAVRELTSTNVWFDPSDDIMSNEEELGDFQTETWMRVQGSTNNSRYHWVETASADHITTDTGLSGTIVAESAGQTITLRQGQTLEIVEPWERTDRVAPGAATISVVHFGHRTAQSFTVPVAMPVERFAIKVAKRGAPTDSLTVQICANASGAPGTVLISATIAASALEDGAPDWVWLLVSPYTLAPGTYWLVTLRNGSLSGTDYFVVEMSEEAHDTTLQFTGGSWQPHTPGWSLPYQIWSAEDLGVQLRAVLDASTQFTQGADYALDFGILSNPTMDQMATGWDAALRLMGVGTSAGERVLLNVTMQGVLRIKTAPVSTGPNNVLWTQDGVRRLTDSAGTPWEEGVLPHGMWLELGALRGEGSALVGDLTPAFVERAEYDAESGALSDVTFAGAKTLADVLKVQQG
jgi:hypothetical protein